VAVSVLTGPVLAGDDDAYRSAQLPRQYWKVAMVKRSGELSVTGYLLSQAALLDKLESTREFSYGAYWTFQVPVRRIPDDVDPTVAELAGAVARCLAELGLERPHVAGNSLGGAVALELARHGAVASVTAISPAGFWSGLERRFAHRSLLASWAISRRIRPYAPRLLGRPRMRRLLYGQMFAHPQRLAPGEALAQMDVLLRGDGFHATLPHLIGYSFPAGDLPVPATIAWGTRDALLLPTQARRARRRLPGARHIWLHGCGHVPMSDDRDQVAAAILRGSAAQ